MKKVLIGLLIVLAVPFIVGKFGESLYRTPSDPAKDAAATENDLVSVVARQWATAALPGQELGLAYVTRLTGKSQQWDFTGDAKSGRYGGNIVHDAKCGAAPHCYSASLIYLNDKIVFRAPR